MPRASDRAKLIASQHKLVTDRMLRRIILRRKGIDDFMNDSCNLFLMQRLHFLKSTRYLERKKNRNRSVDIFKFHLGGNDNRESGIQLTDTEFLERCRMARDNFRALHELVKNHPVFNNAKSKYPGRSESHLCTLLHFLGHRGVNADSTHHALFVGYGTHYNYIMRAVEAVCSLRKNGSLA